MIKTVLVTGGAGFIGSHTVDLLLQKGYTVRVLDALTPPVHQDGILPSYFPASEVEFILGDVRNKADWQRALVGVDAVFHLAAYQDYLTDFSKFFHVNAVGTALLYEVIVESHLPVQKVVVASSQSAYGEGRYRCDNAACSRFASDQIPTLRPEVQLQVRDWEIHCPTCGAYLQPQWTNESGVRPHNQYAMSKYTEEMIAINLGQRYGIPSAAMRYSITQGPRQSFRNAYSGVLRIFVQRLLANLPPICYEDGGQWRDYVSVEDVARANLLVMESESANYRPFNVGGDRRITVLEYAHLIARRAGSTQLPQTPGQYRFGDTRHIFSDVTALKSLGWQPQVGLDKIVDDYIAWAVEQPGFGDYSTKADQVMRELGTVRAVKDN